MIMNQLETPELKQLLRLKEKENNICKASKKKKRKCRYMIF